MRILSTLVTGVFAAALTLAPVLAQDTAKHDIKKAGSDVKDAAKDTGRATKKVGKKAYHGSKRGVHKAAAATGRGVDKVKDKTADK